MIMEYKYINPKHLHFMYDRHILRIKPVNEKIDFGTLKSADGK